MYIHISQNQENHKDIKVFEQLLIRLIDMVDNVKIILPFEKLTIIKAENCPLFSMEIEELTGNKTIWLEKANKTMFIDTEIGKKL